MGVEIAFQQGHNAVHGTAAAARADVQVALAAHGLKTVLTGGGGGLAYYDVALAGCVGTGGIGLRQGGAAHALQKGVQQTGGAVAHGGVAGAYDAGAGLAFLHQRELRGGGQGQQTEDCCQKSIAQ